MSSTITTTATSSSQKTRVASRTSSATEAVCTWEGHCLGDSCASEDDCDRDWICANKTCVACCVTDSEPTFFSTFSTSSSSITSSTTTPSPTDSSASVSTQASSSRLSAGAAAGIGIGGAALLTICIVGGWFFFMRRKKRNEAHELGTAAHSSYPDDRKELYQATNEAQELSTRHPPAELQAVEVAELQGSDVVGPKHGEKAKD